MTAAARLPSPRATAPGSGLDVDVELSVGDLRVAVSFVVEPGETLALLGPNGAGKSTVVGAIAGLRILERGRIALDGRILDEGPAGIHVEPERRDVGVVFQDLLLFPHLTALENVAFPLRAGGARPAAARRRALDWLDRLGVADRARARPATLSGGEAQLVALARALVAEPRLLLLDEPTSTLDVGARSRVRALVAETLARFDGVRVLVTHDPVEAMTLADRLAIVEGGRLTQLGAPQEIRERPRTSYAAELVGLNLFRGRLEPLEGGAGALRSSEGELVVAWPAGIPPGPVDGVLAVLRPADVVLHTRAPEGSARNALRGRVAAVSVEGDRARVRIEASPPLVSEVTLGSVRRLGLSRGADVWASFKAVEVELVLP